MVEATGCDRGVPSGPTGTVSARHARGFGAAGAPAYDRRTMTRTSTRSGWMAIAVALVIGAGATAAAGRDHDKIPITTASSEARALYLQARDLLDKQRAADSHKRFETAVARDPDFALGYLGLADTAPSPREFFAALDRAVALADQASEPERLMIRGRRAGATGKTDQQKELYTRLAEAYPRDERALALLASFYSSQQDFARAVELYTRAVAINPGFTSAYNLLGYAYRALERYGEAEKTFQKYIELCPGDPNPYDSYAELLMKTGRFDESIRSYEKALAIDRHFVSAYIGIASDHLFSGRTQEARKVLARLARIARDDAERRQAMAWTAESFIYERAWDRALGEINEMLALDDQASDYARKSIDLNFRGYVLLEAGRADDAAAAFQAQIEASDRSTSPDEVKEGVRRYTLYDQARVALAKRDLITAKACAASYARQVAARQLPGEIRWLHELAGRIALADGKPRVAVAELTQANQQDPRVLYLHAAALVEAGDAENARTAIRKAAEWNALSLHYGFVRAKAQALARS
ncbi:MAG TPA: tetratricopeptide repeat protein [Kofleriaceae bacterium]